MTPEQWLTRLQRDGGTLEAQALRVILRTFRDVDTRNLITQLAQALLNADPAQRLHAREYLQSLATALYPTLPPDLLTLTRSAVSLGAQVGAGMVPVAAPFVPAVVATVAGETEARLLALWSDARAEHAARTGKIITAALSAGKRYPIRAELERQLKVSRQRAQLIALNEVQTVLNTAQARTIETAADELQVVILATWRTAQDNRVRPTGGRGGANHRVLDGKTVRRGQTFVPGITLRYPHDSAAPPGQTIRCRCVCKYEVQP